MSIEVDAIDAGYDGIEVLRNVSLSVSSGEILGVLGRNGMGKSTLIRAISGLIPLTRGSIRIEGKDVSNWPVHARARAGLTTIVQGRGMFPQMTVRDSLKMGRIASGRSTRDRLDEVLSYFPRLGERLDQPSGSMSGGEQQMLAIGRGLMTDPKVMLLDEPSDGIMPLLVQQIAATLAEINRQEGMTIVIVEQNVPMVMSMAKRCIILEKGSIVASGLPDEISRDGTMQKYLAI
ncbi:ABC transporter ATP-binding protein [Bradyrhizobium sp. SYSU BS000235]|uniref:ABC transporter ATP-binding protein n=1 Tax=Bradyrhizobium sp. SYSU BS000235 TaxID=3411332 RepID=UPI003C7653E0